MISSRDLTAVILAGGKTQKAGAPVASNLEIDGRKVIERQAQLLKSKVSRIEVSVSAPVTWSRFPVTLDAFDPIGPLAGIATSLKYASTDYILTVAGNLAWINPDVLDLLVARAGEPFDACAVRFNFANPNPLFAIYHKRCAQRAIDRLERGDHTAMGLLTSESLAVRWIEDYELSAFDPELKTFQVIGDAGVSSSVPSAEAEPDAPATEGTVFPFQDKAAYRSALAFLPLAAALAKHVDSELGGQLTRASLALVVAIADGAVTSKASAITCAALLDALRALGTTDAKVSEGQALLARLVDELG